MGVALLLLGLLPLVMLPEMVDNDDDSPGPAPDIQPNFPPSDVDQPEDQTSLLDEPEVADVLAPVDEDDVANGGSQNPDPDDVLQPVIEDDDETASDGIEGEILAPVDQIESEANSIYVNFDDAGLGYSEIENFQPGQDVLHIPINPGSVVGEVELAVNTGQNGLDAEVFLEHQLVAILKDAADATAFDVQVKIGEIVA